MSWARANAAGAKHQAKRQREAAAADAAETRRNRGVQRVWRKLTTKGGHGHRCDQCRNEARWVSGSSKLCDEHHDMLT